MSEDDPFKPETGSHAISGNDAKLTVQRSKDSWNYLYVMLGFALTIESSVIPMFTTKFPRNFILFVIVALITCWAFLFNERFRNWLLEVKTSYENGRPH
jgi:hypothetical protein